MKYSIGAVILAVGLVTPELALAYGINMSEGGEPVRWGMDTIGFRMDPELAKAFPNDDAWAAVAMAFDAWRGLPRVPELVLRPGEPGKAGYHSGENENGIYLVREWELNAEMLAVTIVTYGSETGEVLDADVLVNGQAAYRLLDESAPRDIDHYDLAAVMTHEAGHCLGLDESDADAQATMWPQVHPGDTHQRTLSEDDEEGVIANYAGAVPEPTAGCGQASVVGRAGTRASTVVFAAWLLAAALWLTRSTFRRRRAARAGLVLCALLCASPAFMPAAKVAVVAADAGVAATAGPEAPRAAHPAHVAGHPEAGDRADDANRLGRAFGADESAQSLVRGRVQRVSAEMNDGLITTAYVVRDAAGRERRLELLGGEVGGIGQRVLHGEPHPTDGAEIVVSGRGPVAKRWAYSREGQLFGGSLGRGTALTL